MKTTRQLLVIGLVMVGAAFPIWAKPKSLTMPLHWSLNVKGDHPESLPTLETTGGLHTLKVEMIADKRSKGRQLGENREDDDEVIPVFTDSNVAEFVRDNLTTQLQHAGVDVVDDGADRILTLELIELWVVETSSYRTDVRLRARLTDRKGAEIWSAVVNGVGENWGRSLKEDNYNEAFSNAIFEAAVHLLEADGFKKGLKK